MHRKIRSISRRQFIKGICVVVGPVALWGIGSAKASRATATPGMGKPAAYVVPPKIPDRLCPLEPAQVTMAGWLGARVDLNGSHRLLHADLEPLLAGYRSKPGTHAWIGEHIGKWMHAATLTWARTGDAALRERLDYAARELIATQEPDGYLGTYAPDKRFGLEKEAEWDVWSSKYCLVGLLAYYRYTGNESALATSRKVADLLIQTFPSKKSILAAGTHLGMAATSVLEPIVQLYRLTGDTRYLGFAEYIVQAWQEPNGPDIIDSLIEKHKVARVANGKAYEMLSNLVGLSELARVTGDRKMIDALAIAWRDIVDTQLYVSGTTSHHEYFQPDAHMHQEDMPYVGETCVTTTWIQLNQSLLSMTGEARYAAELERSYYNALSAAQHPNGEDWTYFTPLNGVKKYDPEITCCHSSGPRGMSLAPLSAYYLGRHDSEPALIINTLETSSARFDLDGERIGIDLISAFPHKGRGVIRIKADKHPRFAIKLRVPAWVQGFRLKGAHLQDGWALIPPSSWRDGEQIAFEFDLETELVQGHGGSADRTYQRWGPFVLAYEEPDGTPHVPDGSRYKGPAARTSLDTELRLAFQADVTTPSRTREFPLRLIPFADAGIDRAPYRSWLPVTQLPQQPA